jgi:hypothetical protein
MEYGFSSYLTVNTLNNCWKFNQLIFFKEIISCNMSMKAKDKRGYVLQENQEIPYGNRRGKGL